MNAAASFDYSALALSLLAAPALAQVPAAPTLISPNAATGTLTPLYTWNAVSGVATYQLWVNDALQNGRIQGHVSPATAGVPAAPAPAVGTPARRWRPAVRSGG